MNSEHWSRISSLQYSKLFYCLETWLSPQDQWLCSLPSTHGFGGGLFQRGSSRWCLEFYGCLGMVTSWPCTSFIFSQWFRSIQGVKDFSKSPLRLQVGRLHLNGLWNLTVQGISDVVIILVGNITALFKALLYLQTLVVQSVVWAVKSFLLCFWWCGKSSASALPHKNTTDPESVRLKGAWAFSKTQDDVWCWWWTLGIDEPSQGKPQGTKPQMLSRSEPWWNLSKEHSRKR